MKKVLFLMLTVSVAFAAVNSGTLLVQAGNPAASQASNAAFRDGLHLGKFDAGSGRARHLSVGRWSADSNRASFIAGYQAGYQEVNGLEAAKE
jgi:hypothetical protein